MLNIAIAAFFCVLAWRVVAFFVAYWKKSKPTNAVAGRWQGIVHRDDSIIYIYGLIQHGAPPQSAVVVRG
jgi:hypothetical protein